jgi:hypothetical protein
MGRDPLGIDAQLEASLRRITGALEHSRDQYARAVEKALAASDDVLGARAAGAADSMSGPRELDWHREQRARRRRERRAERLREGETPAEADLPQGIVLAVVAVVCLVFGLLRPQFFWMVFVGLGLGMSAAAALGRAAKRRRLEREARAAEAGAGRDRAGARADEPQVTVQEPPPPDDPTAARIQQLCDKLLAELESGPPIVREVVTEPRATIAGLRQACVQTARREHELRAVLAAQDESRLRAERDALAERLAAEQDAIVHDRLGQALAALDQQLVHRAALATAAARLEAENTRILYTIENVHMQLLRARSTDMGAPELGGRLRDSLRELGTQVEAVAEALEWADTPATGATGTGGAAVAGTPGSETVPQARAGAGSATDTDAQRLEAERAERQEAARRAALAREAQKR